MHIPIPSSSQPSTIDDWKQRIIEFVQRIIDQLPITSTRDTALKWWNAWQTVVPEPLRWAVYGIIIARLFYGVLHAIGLTASGIRADRRAAMLRSSLEGEDVPSDRYFAHLRTLSSLRVNRFLRLGALIGLIAGILHSLYITPH